jgi:hypothetical protein
MVPPQLSYEKITIWKHSKTGGLLIFLKENQQKQASILKAKRSGFIIN